MAARRGKTSERLLCFDTDQLADLQINGTVKKCSDDVDQSKSEMMSRSRMSTKSIIHLVWVLIDEISDPVQENHQKEASTINESQ